MRKAKGSAGARHASRYGKKSAASSAVKDSRFGDLIRSKRREMDLTQVEVAARIGISTPYIGHLESGKRHPSAKMVTKFSEVLGINNRELFFLANPQAEALISKPVAGTGSSWEQFKNDENLRRVHNISNAEMELLSQVALMGDMQAPRDLIYILTTIRHAVGR
jgi:transcriptional regulator with XRE-family HTH domain